MSEMEEYLKQERAKVDDYVQTVNALLGLAAFIVHDGTKQRPNSNFGFGRRMTKPSDQDDKPVDFTPDLVAQKNKNYGVVAEAKKTLNRDKEHWDKILDQIKKYDNNLLGWWTEKEQINKFNILLLLHHSRSRAFVNYLKTKLEIDTDCFGKNSCIVEFVKSEEVNTFYSFRLEYGEIRDRYLGSRISESVEIPLDKVKITYPNIQYYDGMPPIAYLLANLWFDIFPSFSEDGVYDQKLKATKFNVDAGKITEEMQKAFGSKALPFDNRSSEFPRQKWIRKALDKLVDLKLATHYKNDEYTIRYKQFKGDILSRFIKLEKKTKVPVAKAQEQMQIWNSVGD